MEIGSFLGSSAILLAGARHVAGSGILHCVDPFDASGDAFSVPIYHRIADEHSTPIRAQFENNLRQAGLLHEVVIHEGTAEEIADGWSAPIDMLFLDGDQSPRGARSAFELWAPFLKPGGVIAVHNSADRVFDPDHDGHRRIVVESIVPPEYNNARCVGSTTFARKAN